MWDCEVKVVFWYKWWVLGGIFLEKVVNWLWIYIVFGGDVKFLLGCWGKFYFIKEIYISIGF